MRGKPVFDAAFGIHVLHLANAGLLVVAALAMFFASTESSMGNVQRILYVHVPAAWFGVVSFVATAVFGALYLHSRAERWDQWAQASAEVCWLCLTLTMLTGSLWAHAAWNTWWTWDPRLTAVFVLWAIASGYLLLRMNLDDPGQSARLRAVAAIMGTLDVPMIVMATRWFRGMHPEAPLMEPGMRLTLWICIACFSGIFAAFIVRRRGQLGLASRIAALGRKSGR
jgi:heme exporter protein C